MRAIKGIFHQAFLVDLKLWWAKFLVRRLIEKAFSEVGTVKIKLFSRHLEKPTEAVKRRLVIKVMLFAKLSLLQPD